MAGRQKTSGRRSGTFDAFDVARRGATLSGTADVASMPRVVDMLSVAQGSGGDSAKVSWRITGTGDPQGRPALSIDLYGSVPLECQRCMQPFQWPVEQHTTLLLARDERELEMLDADDDTLEVILADAPQKTLTLIEDEVLLLLPFAPRCERPGCGGEPLHSHDPNMPGPSAFAALAGLKNSDAK
jgi:uncharacterized protein